MSRNQANTKLSFAFQEIVFYKYFYFTRWRIE